MTHEIRTKRAYDEVAKGDGFRVLVDRIWPRGISKDALELDLWAKEVAPSTELREWFGHDPKRWTEFKRRYKEELRETDVRAKLREILHLAKSRAAITLVYGAKDREHNQALVLKELLERAGRRR